MPKLKELAQNQGNDAYKMSVNALRKLLSDNRSENKNNQRSSSKKKVKLSNPENEKSTEPTETRYNDDTIIPTTTLESEATTPSDKSHIRAKGLKEYPGTDTYSDFKEFVESKGYSYEDFVLRRVWTQSVNDKAKLTILAGPPGSGKTALVSLLAKFFNRDLIEVEEKAREDDYLYLLEPVLPSWFSPESLLGFYDQVNSRFRSTRFLKFVQRAEQNQSTNRKFFACLDEFNLAQPEQYLAKILSVMESESKRITVCQEEDSPVEVTLTPNLKLFATVNTDAASKLLSPKVLDRACLISIIPTWDAVIRYVQNYVQKLPADDSKIRPILKEFEQILKLLFDLSQSAQSPFGYRTLNAVFFYLKSHPYVQTSNSSLTLREIRDVIDEIVCSFFLSKLPGKTDFEEHKAYGQEVQRAKTVFSAHQLTNSIRIIENIRIGYPGQSAFIGKDS